MRFREGKRDPARETGVSAVEFGLILPLLLVLILGIIDYGWVFYVKLNITNAAREGARVGVVQETDTDVASQARTAAQNYLAAAGLPTSGTVSVAATLADPVLTVNVTVPDFTQLRLIGFVPLPPSLSASAVMRWELAP